MQLTHENSSFERKTFPITVICDAIYFQQNIGSIFRLCDAFGVEKIIFTGENFILSERKINKTSRNTHKTVPFEILLDRNEVISYLAKHNSEIIALEITEKSKEITNLEIINKPIVLLIGSEIYGISNSLLQLANQTTHISMYGKNSSMNVTHALAICLQNITTKLNAHD